MRLRPSAVALMAVLALVAGACASGDRAPETSAADAPVRSPTTTAPPPPVLERVALEPAVFAGEGDQRLVAVAAGSPGGGGGPERLVAVGSVGGRASVWWSIDGIAWERPALVPQVFTESSTVADVVADPVSGGFVAVGGVGDVAAAWASPDGESWTRAEVDPGPAMDIVESTRLGLIAFGTGPAAGSPDGAVGPPGIPNAGAGDPVEETAAWQSFSGERWLRAVDDPDLFVRPGAERVTAVVDVGLEVQALVEREGQGAERWRTTDGQFWSQGPDDATDVLAAGGVPTPAAASALGSALVVVGTDAKADGVDAAMWMASGTQELEQLTHDEAVFGGDGAQAMTALAPVGEVLIVVGTETGDDGDVDAVVWSTGPASGISRSGGPEPVVPGDQHVVDLTVIGTTAVAVGWEESAEGIDAMVWIVDRAPGPDDAPPGSGSGAGQAPPPELAWQRVGDQESLAGPGEERLEAVVALSDGFVAVGSAPDPSDPAGVDGAVWRSIDGREWSRSAAAGFGGSGDQRLLDVAASPVGLVAAGFDGSSAAVWTSPEGSVWNRVPSDEAVFGGPGDQRAEAVAARPGGGGWVAVGSDGLGDGAVWSSAGGTWARVSAEGLAGAGDQALLDVVAGSSGLVAVGTEGEAAVAWISTDAAVWSRAELGAGRATALAGGQGALVAVGSTAGDTGRDTVTWRSANGSTWQRLEGDDLAGPLDQGAGGVTVGDGVIVAVGATNLGGGGDAAAWTSADAGTWARSAHDENTFGGDQDQQMTDVASVGGLVVAVGWSGSTPELRDGAVWVADLAGGSARSRL